MKPAEQVIREALRYDHRNGGNVQRILDGLREAGWLLAPARDARLPETMRVFSPMSQAEPRGRRMPSRPLSDSTIGLERGDD